jgi:hypothetical protein
MFFLPDWQNVDISDNEDEMTEEEEIAALEKIQ